MCRTPRLVRSGCSLLKLWLRFLALFAQIENGDAELGSSRFQTVRRILNSSLRRVTALILLVPLSILLAWITVYALRAIVRISPRWRRHETTQDIVSSSTAPIVLILAVIFHQIGVH